MCCSAVQSVYGVEGLGGRQGGWRSWWGWALRKCCFSHFQSCYEHMQGRELLNRRINRSLTLDLRNAVVRRSQSSELHWNLFFWPPHNLLCAISLISIITALAFIIFKQHKVRYCWSVHFFSSDTQMSQSAAAPRAQGCTSPGSAAEFRPVLWSCCCCRCRCDMWIHCEIMFIFLPSLPWKCMNLCRTVRRCWARGAKKLVDCLKEQICLFGKRPPTISDSDGQWNSCFLLFLFGFSVEFISSLSLMIMCVIIIEFIMY